MTHRNARLTPVTCAELVEQVLAGWPQAEVARLFRVSRATVAKWVRRFREGGPDALIGVNYYCRWATTIFAGSVPPVDCVVGPRRCGSWARRIQG